jgi:hypothetical protein
MFAGETKDGKHVIMRDKNGHEKKVLTRCATFLDTPISGRVQLWIFAI